MKLACKGKRPNRDATRGATPVPAGAACPLWCFFTYCADRRPVVRQSDRRARVNEPSCDPVVGVSRLPNGNATKNVQPGDSFYLVRQFYWTAWEEAWNNGAVPETR